MTLIIGTDANTGDAIKIEYDDLTLGTAIDGKTGSGKSALLSHMIQECVRQGTCSFVLDPHGDLCRTVINTTPRKFIDNLVLIDIDPAYPFQLNPFYFADPTEILAVDNHATNFVTLFKKILGNDERMTRTDRILQNIATVFIANQGHTMLEVPEFLQNETFRRQLLQTVTNPAVVRYWRQDYERLYADSHRRSDQIDPVLNRIGTLIEQTFLARMFAESVPSIYFSELFHTRKVYLIDLSMLSESNQELVGTLLLFQLAIAIYARDIKKKQPRVSLFIDEYGKFALSDITTNLLLQGRKFECSTTCAIQVLASLPDEENKQSFLNTGNIIAFRCVGEDAGMIAENFDTTPPPVTPRKLAVPVNVFDHLLRAIHPNPEVWQLIQDILLPLQRMIELNRITPANNIIQKVRFQKNEMKKQHLNNILMETLEGKITPGTQAFLQEIHRCSGNPYLRWEQDFAPEIGMKLPRLCELLLLEENQSPFLVPAEQDTLPRLQQTYADMEKKLANDLVTLPKYYMLCQFTKDTGMHQSTVRLKDPLPWLRQITEEEIRASGQTLFGRQWQQSPNIPKNGEINRPSPHEPPERRTWEEE